MVDSVGGGFLERAIDKARTGENRSLSDTGRRLLEEFYDLHSSSD